MNDTPKSYATTPIYVTAKQYDEYLKGLSAIEVARIVMPDAGDDELESIIWGATGFPAFWRTEDPASEFLEQIRAAAEMRKAGTLDEHIRKAWTMPPEVKEQDDKP